VLARTTCRVLCPAVLVLSIAGAGRSGDDDLIPKLFTTQQRERIETFLKEHQKDMHYIPPNAKLVGAPPGGGEAVPEEKPTQPVKQYLTQLTPHRPVPGQEQVTKLDVYYYRPNPERGKPGITVKRTLDVTTGKEVGQTEVIFNGKTPLAREELAEAVDLAKEKSEPVQALYKQFDKSAVHWEYLQLTINRKHESLEPGDRALMLTFTADPAKAKEEPALARVIVNLTKGVVGPAAR